MISERTVSIYAEIINVNAYDQPGVEAGKKAASEMLLLKESIFNFLEDGKPRSIQDIYEKTNAKSKEYIYIILRHIITNSSEYTKEGSWSNPEALIVRHINKYI